MGQNDRDSVYYAHYRNEDLTNDFQAIVHGVDAENLLIIGSITLNRKEDTPRYPSDAGVLAALQDPELRELLEEKSNEYDKIIQTYGSVSKAQVADPSLFKRYSLATQRAGTCRARLLTNKFREEYRSFFQGDVVANVHEKDILDLYVPLDPALGGAPVPPSKVLSASEASQLDPEMQVAADHVFGNASPQPLSSNPRDEQRTLVMMVTSVDKAAAALCGAGCDIQDPELMDIMVQCYSSVHASDTFFPGTEPLPGTYVCRFCGILLDGHPGAHAFICYKQAFF
jgi:hypothetical protein